MPIGESMNLIADIRFAEESPEELKNAAQVLRYVAAINPLATRQQFVEACVSCGYRANSSANRFRESRAFDCSSYGYTTDADGRLIGA
jgi:hypothetical protein